MESIKCRSVLIGLCLFIGLMIPTYQIFIQENLQKKEAEQNLLERYSDIINLNMMHRYNYTRTLQTILAANSYNFPSIAPAAHEILKNKDCLYVSVIENESITAFYSNNAAKSMVGMSLPSLDFTYNLARSVADKVIEGPLYDPIVNAQVFLIVQPIYRDNVYIGEIAVAIDAAAVIKSFGLEKLRANRFDYELWRINTNDGSKNIITQSDQVMFFANAQEIKIDLPCVWRLTIVKRDHWWSNSLLLGAVVLAVLISVLTALFVYGVFMRRKLSNTISEQDLYDRETHFLNREGFLLNLQQRLESYTDKEYQLLFLKIKNYDQLAPLLSKEEKIKYFTFFIERIDDFIESEYVIGRISESTFAILISDMIISNELYHFERGLSLELLYKFSLQDKKIILPVVYGSVKILSDGTSANTLLLSAIEDCETRFSSE